MDRRQYPVGSSVILDVGDLVSKLQDVRFETFRSDRMRFQQFGQFERLFIVGKGIRQDIGLVRQPGDFDPGRSVFDEFLDDRSGHRGRSREILDMLPVDHAVDEIDRVAVRRERHQDAAVADAVAARVVELGLEADRRAVGDDLHVMIGQARQQRAARHVGDGPGVVVELAFLADRGADVGDAPDCRVRR